VACAAALAVLDIIEEENLVARAAVLGERIMARFRVIQQRSPLVGEVRGVGAMVAMELVKDRGTKVPAVAETNEIIRRAMQHGVLLLRAGLYNNVVRVLMPLVITDDQLDEALDVLEASVREVSNEFPLL